MSRITPMSPSWEDVYHANLLEAFLAPGMELINHTFELPRAWADNERCIQNPARGFRVAFCDVMAEWILSGQVRISDEMRDLNPNAVKFATVLDQEPYGHHVTAYGPRIAQQLNFVVAELTRFPDSRRACIMMLAPSDQLVAEAMANGDTQCEYLCTYAFNFRIRDGLLDMVVSMRSNNYTTTVCQDVYVFHRLQQHVAQMLHLKTGRYYHSTVSGHIVKGEEQRAYDILDLYFHSETFAGAFPAKLLLAWDEMNLRAAELGLR